MMARQKGSIQIEREAMELGEVLGGDLDLD
jgi:hypothetical protein